MDDGSSDPGRPWVFSVGNGQRVLFSPCHLASIPLIVAYVAGQEQLLQPRQAGAYSIAFTLGLFITIAVIGIVCSLVGRMLGDVGNY